MGKYALRTRRTIFENVLKIVDVKTAGEQSPNNCQTIFEQSLKKSSRNLQRIFKYTVST